MVDKTQNAQNNQSKFRTFSANLYHRSYTLLFKRDIMFSSNGKVVAVKLFGEEKKPR